MQQDRNNAVLPVIICCRGEKFMKSSFSRDNRLFDFCGIILRRLCDIRVQVQGAVSRDCSLFSGNHLVIIQQEIMRVC